MGYSFLTIDIVCGQGVKFYFNEKTEQELEIVKIDIIYFQRMSNFPNVLVSLFLGREEYGVYIHVNMLFLM